VSDVADDVEFAAPTGASIVSEIAGLVQLPRLALRAPKLVGLPRGDETVVLFPGYSTNDLAQLPLRAALRALGHRPFGWGFGVNRAEVEAMLDPVIDMVERRVNETGKPATLIGWSNGGIFARETARDRPDLVDRVITYGTPVFGGPKYTRGATLYPQDEVDRIADVVDARNVIPIEQPITSIYSKMDNIVDWRACIDTFSPNVENIEVSSTHAGMLVDPDIWTIIAKRLCDEKP